MSTTFCTANPSIDHGAKIAGKTRTDFMLDAACEK
nr:DUF1778 domain-containing protein [Acidithiobacillus ferrianus]